MVDNTTEVAVPDTATPAPAAPKKKRASKPKAPATRPLDQLKGIAYEKMSSKELILVIQNILEKYNEVIDRQFNLVKENGRLKDSTDRTETALQYIMETVGHAARSVELEIDRCAERNDT